jgi:tetratricopeptide (TPR) repeat protein
MFWHLNFVLAVSDSELLELEKQIEQQETAEKESKQQELEDARRKEEKSRLKAEEQKLIKERARIEEERRALESLKQTQERNRLQVEQEKLKKEKELQTKFNNTIETANAALKNKDRNTAIKQFEQALAIYPDNDSAKQGLTEAKKLKDKVCYEVLGEWLWNDGAATLVLKEDGSLDYRYWGNHTGQWECTNPASRQIHVTITALGFTQEWSPVLSQDNTCLRMKLALSGPDCLYRSN